MALAIPTKITKHVPENLPILQAIFDERTYVSHDELLQMLLDLGLAIRSFNVDFATITTASYANAIFNNEAIAGSKDFLDVGKYLFSVTMATTKATRAPTTAITERPYTLDAYVVIDGDVESTTPYTTTPDRYDFNLQNIGKFELYNPISFALSQYRRKGLIVFYSNTSGATLDVQTTLDSYYVDKPTFTVIKNKYKFRR